MMKYHIGSIAQALLLLLLVIFLEAPRATVAAQKDGSGEDETGEHPGWPRWCGKVYKAGYPAFEPGGHTTPPANGTEGEANLLHVQFAARHSIYVAPETAGTFIVRAALSPWYGEPYAYENLAGEDGEEEDEDGATRTKPFTELSFSIHLDLSDEDDVGDYEDSSGTTVPLIEEATISIGESGAEFAFDLAERGIAPRLAPYRAVLRGSPASGDSNYTYTATAELAYLPAVPAGGSATKIDRQTGSLLFWTSEEREGKGEPEWTPLLPYGYYGLYNGSNDTAAADAFVRDYTSDGTGLTAIIALAGFAEDNPVYDSMDAQGLRFMFDLRGSYQNLTETEARVRAIQNHSMLFAYWTADEYVATQLPCPLFSSTSFVTTDYIHFSIH